MILELDTSILEKLPDLSINQLVLLTLCLNKDQNQYQDVHQFISRISETEIQALTDKGLITVTTLDDGSTMIDVTEEFKKIADIKQDFFDIFYKTYPVYVTRPDGTQGFLRGNINKCRKYYNHLVGKSRAMHERILDALKADLSYKMQTGKLGYMKTMWKWLVTDEWQAIIDQMNNDSANITTASGNYGTTIV